MRRSRWPGPASQTVGMVLVLPRNLAEHAGGRGRSQWVASLPAIVDGLRVRWSLEIGEPFQPGGQTSWVAPARHETFGDVVLKVACRHYEALDEAQGLREWDGNGAIRLLLAEDVEESTAALLLERCRPGNALSREPGETQDRVIAGLLRRLWKVPQQATSFRPLQQMCDQWADACEQEAGEHLAGRDPGLVREGIALFRSLPRSAARHVLLATDLHADNVLAGEREPWLVIDPKPYVGDPTYDVLQHLLNCGGRLVEDPLDLVERLGELAGLDPARLALWLFARCVVASTDQPELFSVARRLAPS